MDTIQAIEARRSVRNYTPRPVERALLSTLVRAANQAPKTGAIHLSMVTGAALLRSLDEAVLQAMKTSENEFLMSRAAIPGFRPFYGAPAILLLSAPAEGYGEVNAACAATTVSIAATSLGLGSCYVVTPTLVLNTDAKLRTATGIPADYRVMCGVLIGYGEGQASVGLAERQMENVTFCE